MAQKEIDIVVITGGLIDELETAANKNGATIYNICHRNAGWAIQWHEEKKQGESQNWKDGLAELYRQTFNNPKFNPRWKNGTASYIEVVLASIPTLRPMDGEGDIEA